MQMACMKCQRLLAVEVQAEGATFGPDDDLDIDVADGHGILLAVCVDCMSAWQAWQRLVRNAARMVDVLESYEADLAMIRTRVPAVTADPRFAGSAAKTAEDLTHWREVLAALLDNEPAPDGA